MSWIPQEPPADLAGLLDPDGAELADGTEEPVDDGPDRAPTAMLRQWWAPWYAGRNEFTDLQFFGKTIGGVPTVAVDAYRALEATLRATGHTPGSAWAFNVRNIAGSDLPSLHSYGIALDLDPGANPYVTWAGWHQTRFTPEQIAAVDAIRNEAGVRVWKWGGSWRPRADLMHFQIDCHPDDLKKGVTNAAARTTPKPKTSDTPPPKAPSGTMVAVTVNLPKLKQGDKGDDVRLLQGALASRDPELKVDGSFGPKTDAAVRTLQSAKALEVDGVVGKYTWGALLGR